MLVFQVLAFIFLTTIGVAILQAINAWFTQERRYYAHHYWRDLLLVDVVISLMYALIVGVIFMLYIGMGYDPIVLYIAIGMLAVATLVMFVRHLMNHRRSIDRRSALLFLIWLVIVLYATLFSRWGNEGRTVALMRPFRGLSEAINERSFEPLVHSFLNILMFVPFGYLIPCVNPRHLSKMGFSMLGGIVSSALIESIQLLTGLGCCDIDDIIANSVGAIIGYGLYQLGKSISRNWRIG